LELLLAVNFFSKLENFDIITSSGATHCGPQPGQGGASVAHQDRLDDMEEYRETGRVGLLGLCRAGSQPSHAGRSETGSIVNEIVVEGPIKKG